MALKRNFKKLSVSQNLTYGFTKKPNLVSRLFATFTSIFSFQSNRQTKPNLARGFTIVEMIVSVAIFSIVIVISVGSLLSIIAVNKQTQSMKSVVGNLNYALETMIRSIRTGSGYDCDLSTPALDSCPVNLNSPTDSIMFVDQRGYKVIYRLINMKIIRDVYSLDGGFISSFDLTSPEVSIDRLNFYVSGVGSGSADQPNVTILIGGKIVFQGGRTTRFDLETMAVQRLFNQ